MDHYLTEHEYKSVGDWEKIPRDLKVITGREDRTITLPKIGCYWRHTNTGDVVVACDDGVGGSYELYHIPSQYVDEGHNVLKKLRIGKDTTKYSHGGLILRRERTDPTEFIEEIYKYLETVSDGVYDETLLFHKKRRNQ